MSRHRFRWESLAFGLFFLAIVGNWAVWKQELLTPRELTLVAAAMLILLGLIGVAATLRPAHRAPSPTSTEGEHHEEADPQS